MQTTTIESSSYFKSVRVFDYDDGEIQSTLNHDDPIEYLIRGDDLHDVVKDILQLTGCDYDSIAVNACDEPGRIDANMLHTASGYNPTESELEDWKAGKLTLFSVTYSFYFEEVTRKPAIF